MLSVGLNLWAWALSPAPSSANQGVSGPDNTTADLDSGGDFPSDEIDAS